MSVHDLGAVRFDKSMRFAFLFFVLAVGCVILAMERGAFYWLLLWPAFSTTVVALCYASLGPGPIGKRSDGTIRWRSVVGLFPYFVYAWGIWRLRQAMTSEPSATEVYAGVWVGRRPSPHELPTHTKLIVDLAAEFPAARRVREHPGYLSLPTLDGTATDVPRMRTALDQLESVDGVAYIHCALGHGRSAALAAALMVRRGLAPDVAAAETLMRERRPAIRLKHAQRIAAAEAART